MPHQYFLSVQLVAFMFMFACSYQHFWPDHPVWQLAIVPLFRPGRIGSRWGLNGVEETRRVGFSALIASPAIQLSSLPSSAIRNSQSQSPESGSPCRLCPLATSTCCTPIQPDFHASRFPIGLCNLHRHGLTWNATGGSAGRTSYGCNTGLPGRGLDWGERLGATPKEILPSIWMEIIAPIWPLSSWECNL